MALEITEAMIPVDFDHYCRMYARRCVAAASTGFGMFRRGGVLFRRDLGDALVEGVCKRTVRTQRKEGILPAPRVIFGVTFALCRCSARMSFAALLQFIAIPSDVKVLLTSSFLAPGILCVCVCVCVCAYFHVCRQQRVVCVLGPGHRRAGAGSLLFGLSAGWGGSCVCVSVYVCVCVCVRACFARTPTRSIRTRIWTWPKCHAESIAKSNLFPRNTGGVDHTTTYICVFGCLHCVYMYVPRNTGGATFPHVLSRPNEQVPHAARVLAAESRSSSSGLAPVLYMNGCRTHNVISCARALHELDSLAGGGTFWVHRRAHVAGFTCVCVLCVCV